MSDPKSRCNECSYCTNPSHVNARGDVRTVAVRMKNRWKAANSNKSLKAFVRELLKTGDHLATQWMENKKGMCNEMTNESNRTRAALERNATKLARKSKKKPGGAS